ncbi:MAG: aromatic ring-opening dioxygenase LigA [Propioniciclava sp.]
MNKKPLKVAGIFSLIIGALFLITGVGVWGVVSSQLAAERITVPPDAAFLAGDTVDGPLSALAQADIINHHAMTGSGGKTYAELGAESQAAAAAGDTALAEELSQQRATVMTSSFLRASLFTSVLSFGVCLFAMGVGVVLLVIGWAFVKVSGSIPAEATAEAAKADS